MGHIDQILAAAQELGEKIPGLEVIGDDYIHLKLTDVRLAMFFEPLNYLDHRPNPPPIFDTQVKSSTGDRWRTIPWITPNRQYFNEHYASLEGPFVVSFVNHMSQASDSYDRRRQNKKYAKRRRDKLVDAGVSAEHQIVKLMDDRVGEPVVQKLAVLWLRSQGWLVSDENQYSPRKYMPGRPDVVAWRSPLLSSLQDAGLTQAGATLDELAYLTIENQPLQNQSSTESFETQSESLVAEVKGSNKGPSAPKDQLNKYLSSGYFDYGYGVVPGYPDRTPNRGFITFDQNGFETTPGINELTEENRSGQVREDERDWFIRHMDRVACQALLCNLDYDQIQCLAADEGSDTIEHPYDLVDKLWTMSPETVITEIIAGQSVN